MKNHIDTKTRKGDTQFMTVTSDQYSSTPTATMKIWMSMLIILIVIVNEMFSTNYLNYSKDTYYVQHN